MFQVGELILYGNSGVCRVEAIGQPGSAAYADKNKEYYTLAPLFGEGVIYVPVDTPVFMRPVIKREEAMELIHRIPEIQAEPFSTRDQRALGEHYRRFFDSHRCDDLVHLIKDVYMKGQNLSQQGKKIGITDQQYLRRARDLLHGELAVALEIPLDEVEEFICKEIEA